MVLAQQWDSSALSFMRFWFAKGFFLPVSCLGKWSLQDVTYQQSQLHFSSPQKSWELSTILTSLLPTQKEISSLPSHTHHEGPNSVSPLTWLSDPCMHCVGYQAEFWVPFIAPSAPHPLTHKDPSTQLLSSEKWVSICVCSLHLRSPSPALCLTWEKKLEKFIPFQVTSPSFKSPPPTCLHAPSFQSPFTLFHL